MSKKKRPLKKATAPAPDITAGQDGAPPSPSLEQQSQRRMKYWLLTVLLIIFVLFEVMIITLFQSGGSIKWKKELTEVESLFNAGNYEQAAAELTTFGENWPGARETFDWNKRMGLYHSKTDQWETAAKYYAAAVEIDPTATAINALAGEAAFKAGDRDAATEFLATELTETKRAVGDHDRANFYLGKILLENKQYIEAFQHFQSITNRDQWQTELAPIYEQINKEIIQPAREMAGE
jgi:tetratricopeptide (TPR) repeat protein